MTMSVHPMGPGELERVRILPDAGFGVLRTDRGNLPLDRLDVNAKISGLVARTAVRTEFVNTHEVPLEATYVFPLPDRAAVTGMTLTADNRTVEAELRERGAAREAYDSAIAAGQRASIAEEDRSDVFSMRVGNILPGERVTVELRLVGPLPFEDGAATFRFPLVVAPRYVPGTPIGGPPAGDGRQLDTDAVPDASRISPPVLLPGFPNPLRLSLRVEIDPAGLTLGDVRSSLHTVSDVDGTISIRPGERADRDFVLRLAYSGGSESAVAVPDHNGDNAEGVYHLVVLPPDDGAAAKPKDVVLLLDRSGSMGGWKMVAARRAAARVIDTLTAADRFAVLTFDHEIDRPTDLDPGLSAASDRNRFRAVEHLARADARGGTELLAPLVEGLDLLRASEGRPRVLVLVTDGQVGNEDQIIQEIAPTIGPTRIHTIGIDRAVNAGFLGRLAALGGGRAELVESEDRLDAAMEHIHRRIGSPVVTDLRVTATGLRLIDDERSPARLPGIYPGVPLVVTGRYAGTPDGSLTISGRTRDDREFSTTVAVRQRAEPAITAQWARARLRDLEDAYAAGDHSLEQRIVATSLRYGVLCRFTAFVAVDSRVVNEGGRTRRVTQPVELPAGWEAPGSAATPVFLAAASHSIVAPAPPSAPAPGRFAPAQASESAAPRRAKRSHTAGGFGAAPAMLRAGNAAGYGNAAPSLDEVRALVTTEVRRLHAAAGAAAYERRELLEDLASRLSVLVTGVTAPEFAPLRDLVAVLEGDGGLDEKWTAAVEILTAFAGAASSSGDGYGADGSHSHGSSGGGSSSGSGSASSTGNVSSGGGGDGALRSGDRTGTVGEGAPGETTGKTEARKPFWKR